MNIAEFKAALQELSKYPIDVLELLVTKAQEDGDFLLLSHLYYIMHIKTKG